MPIAAQFYSLVLQPAATMLSGIQARLDSPRARTLLLAIAGQESGWTSRIQIPGGEARGFWQCELDGAVDSVMLDDSRHAILAQVASLYSIDVDVCSVVFEAIAWHDPLAYTLARLTLWTDPHPLPPAEDIEGAWQVYLRTWRPGKPSRDRWSMVYPQAVLAVGVPAKTVVALND